MAGAPYMAVMISNPTLVKLNAYQATGSGVLGIQLYFPRAQTLGIVLMNPIRCFSGILRPSQCVLRKP